MTSHSMGTTLDKPNTLFKTLKSIFRPESSQNLYAYNNTPIRQFDVCSVWLNFKGKSGIYKFYVVKHATAILGISDSEKLGLVKVNFDTIDKLNSVELVHITSDSFKRKNEMEYPELFKGVGRDFHKTLRWSNTPWRTH